MGKWGVYSPGDRPADSRLTRSELEQAAESWIGDGKAIGLAAATLRQRREWIGKLVWFLQQEELPLAFSSITPSLVRRFLTYAREAHPDGRWGTDRPSCKRQARPATVGAAYRIVQGFLRWCEAEGREIAPVKNVKAPRVPRDQVVPLSPEQLQALFDAARRSRSPTRDLAIVMLLADSGMRVGELCGLSVGDVDRCSGQLMVTGKGNKRRHVYMGSQARRCLWRYLEAEHHEAPPTEPLFVAQGGHNPGGRLTPNGVHRILARSGRSARITGVRCSPHTLRHTFAVNFLRGGGNLLELQPILGHTDLAMVRRYVALAETDLAQAHRAASPVDRLKLR